MSEKKPTGLLIRHSTRTVIVPMDRVMDDYAYIAADNAAQGGDDFAESLEWYRNEYPSFADYENVIDAIIDHKLEDYVREWLGTGVTVHDVEADWQQDGT